MEYFSLETGNLIGAQCRCIHLSPHRPTHTHWVTKQFRSLLTHKMMQHGVEKIVPPEKCNWWRAVLAEEVF